MIDHVALQPGRRARCACGEPASRFMRCRVAKCLLAWCGNCSPRNAADARLEHERGHTK